MTLLEDRKMKIPVNCLISLIALISFPVSAENVVISNAAGLPSYILKELSQIALDSGNETIALSSKKRTVKKQVEVMLDYYILCTKISDPQKKKGCGIALAKQVYDKECHGGFAVYNPESTREHNIQMMTAALTQSLIKLGENRVCMNHVVIAGIKTRIIAVDVKPSSVKNKSRFYDAVLANQNVVQFYYPDIAGKPESKAKDAAFHIGFLRQQKAR